MPDDAPVLVWVDDYLADHDMIDDRYIEAVQREVEDQFDVKVFGGDDDAIEYVFENQSRIFMFIQDSYRHKSEIIPAWKQLRPITSPAIGHASRQGDFYTYVIDAFTPRAASIFAGHSFTDEETKIISEWGKSDKRIILVDKSKLFMSPKAENGILSKIVKEQLARWLPSEPEANVSVEGKLVQPLAEEMAILCGSRPSSLDHMTPRKFEEVIAALFRNHGFSVELTARTRDGGYDIVAASHPALESETILIEVKHFAPGRPVGVGIVRALYGVKCLQGASKAILVTSSYVSNYAAREFERVIPWEIEFIERNKILQWCREYISEVLTESVETS